MSTIILNTESIDGMYLDIESVQFEYSRAIFNKTIENAQKIIESNNNLLNAVTLKINDTTGIKTLDYFNSTVDDENKSNEIDSRIDHEEIRVSKYSVHYRGFCKHSSQYIEVNLSSILKQADTAELFNEAAQTTKEIALVTALIIQENLFNESLLQSFDKAYDIALKFVAEYGLNDEQWNEKCFESTVVEFAKKENLETLKQAYYEK